MTSDPMVRREAYDEEAQVPATRSVCRDEMSFESVDVGDFQDWIRKVVACNKTLCHHAYGDHPYRWVQLTGLDLSAVDQVLSAGKSELFLSLESIRRGVLHQDYIDSLVIDKGAEPAVEFKICFCHPSQW